MQFRNRLYSSLNICFKILPGFGCRGGAKVPRKVCGLTELNHLYLSRNADQGYIRPELIVLCVCSLDGPYKPIDRLPCRLQKPLNPTELIDSWRTIKQLRNLNSDELQVRWRPLIRFKPYVLLTYLFLFLYGSAPGCAEPP
jgi:hypothetical protein